MTLKTRLAKLETQYPKAPPPKWPDFSFRHCGHSLWENQQEMARRLREAIADRRATAAQRSEWTELAQRVEKAAQSNREGWEAHNLKPQ